jgi:excisionase family DNA binding protein
MQAENLERGYTTVKGGSAFTGISVAKLYQLMASGELPFVKLGKSRRIAWSALDELMRRHTVNGTSPEVARN